MDDSEVPCQIMIKVISNHEKYDDEYLRKFCYNTGRILRFHLAPGPKLCFVTFKMKRDAVNAMTELNKTGCISVQFSRKQPVVDGDGQSLQFVDSQKDHRKDGSMNFANADPFNDTETGSQSSFGKKNNYDSFRHNNNKSTEQNNNDSFRHKNNYNNKSTEQNNNDSFRHKNNYNNKSTEQNNNDSFRHNNNNNYYYNNKSREQNNDSSRYNNNKSTEENNNDSSWNNNKSTEENNSDSSRNNNNNNNNNHNNKSTEQNNINHMFKNSGKCNYCNNKTTNRCSVCYDFYCSVECQREDWPKHKKDCISVPPLLKGNENDSTSNHSNATKSLTSEKCNLSETCNAIGKENLTVSVALDATNDDSTNKYKPPNNNNNNTNTNNYNNNKNEKESFNNNYKKGDDNYKSPPNTNNNLNDIESGINSMAIKPTSKGGSSPQQQQQQQQHAVKNQNITSINPLKGIETIIPMSESIVEITHVFTSTIVFCRAIDNPTHDNRYKQNIVDIIKYSETAKMAEKLPARDEIVLAKYDDIYFRGIIAKVVSDTEVKVLFTEYGNVETIALHDLKEITNDDIKYRPQYVCRADLGGICSGNLTAQEKELCIEYLNELVNKPLRMVYEGTLTRNVPVKFYIASTNECVNDTLLELIQTQ